MASMFYKHDCNFQVTVLCTLVDFQFPSLCYMREISSKNPFT